MLVQPRLQPQSNSALFKPLSPMQIDHTNYPKRLKGLDSEALRFIIKDCREAINALPDNPKNGYYADEINYCVMELHRRKISKLNLTSTKPNPLNPFTYEHQIFIQQPHH